MMNDQPDGVDEYDELAAMLGDDTSEDEDTQPEEHGDEEAPAEDKPEDKPKFKVTVKDELGNDAEEEVEQDELVKGYMRQRDYTHKTQALASREREAAEVFEGREADMRKQYTQSIDVTHKVLDWVQSAGARQLLAEDPTEFVRLAASAANHFRDEMQREQGAKLQAAQEAQRKAISQAWSRLAEDGVTHEGVKTIFDKAEKLYGLGRERLDSIADRESVLVLRDAIAYREIKDKKPQTPAAQVPAPATHKPQRTRAIEDATRPYRTKGTGTIKDLARYLDATRR